MERISKTSFCGSEVATRLALLGETDKALNLIEENFRSGGSCWNGLNVEPAFDKLRDEPRFQEVLRQMGFAE